jgi:hypothetical protein
MTLSPLRRPRAATTKVERVVSGMLRMPCHVHLRGKDLVVPDLAGRVAILGETNELLCHRGDQSDEGLRAQNGVGREQW